MPPKTQNFTASPWNQSRKIAALKICFNRHSHTMVFLKHGIWVPLSFEKWAIKYIKITLFLNNESYSVSSSCISKEDYTLNVSNHWPNKIHRKQDLFSQGSSKKISFPTKPMDTHNWRIPFIAISFLTEIYCWPVWPGSKNTLYVKHTNCLAELGTEPSPCPFCSSLISIFCWKKWLQNVSWKKM